MLWTQQSTNSVAVKFMRSKVHVDVGPHIHTHMCYYMLLSHTRPIYSQKLLSSFNQLSYQVNTSTLLY